MGSEYIGDVIERFMRRVTREIREMIERFEEELRGPLCDPSTQCLEPLTEIFETPDEVVIRFDLPYVRNKDSIQVSVSEDTVTLYARLEGVSIRTGHIVYRGVKFFAYRKSVRLPCEVDPERTRARFKDGILELRLPKKTKRYYSVRVE